MAGHFWINPLGIDESSVDGRDSASSNHESRHCRSVKKSPSTEAFLKEDSISSFLKSAEVASGQIEDLKAHMIDVQYSHLDPDSLSSHQYEFLNVPDEIVTNNDTTLLEVFHYFQKYAVTFFEILKDTEEVEQESEYYTMLLESKDKLVRLLGDIQLAMAIHDLTPYEDVTYEMLPSHMKDKKRASSKSLRDYIVIRDYSHFLGFILNQKENFMELAI